MEEGLDEKLSLDRQLHGETSTYIKKSKLAP